MENEIKRCWNSTYFRSDMPAERKFRRMTALQSLMERYRRFSRLSLVFAFLSPLWIGRMLSRSGVGNGWEIYGLEIFIFLYFMLASVMDRWLARGISAINLSEMPVAEVCRRAYYYRRQHFRFMAVLLPMALLLVLWLGWLLSDDVHFLYGISSGLVLGSVCGYGILRKFMREYRELTIDD